MDLIYGTTNKAKIEFMKRRVEHLGIEILSLNDVGAPKMYIEEDGNSPIANAKIKALAYYDALKMPVFSCDSGLSDSGIDNAPKMQYTHYVAVTILQLLYFEGRICK